MNRENAIAAWEVVAGLIPEQPIPEHTRRWVYTSSDYSADMIMVDNDPDNPDIETKFKKLRAEAFDYAAGLQYPAHLNWVRVDWIWF